MRILKGERRDLVLGCEHLVHLKLDRANYSALRVVEADIDHESSVLIQIFVDRDLLYKFQITLISDALGLTDFNPLASFKFGNYDVEVSSRAKVLDRQIFALKANGDFCEYHCRFIMFASGCGEHGSFDYIYTSLLIHPGPGCYCFGIRMLTKYLSYSCLFNPLSFFHFLLSYLFLRSLGRFLFSTATISHLINYNKN